MLGKSLNVSLRKRESVFFLLVVRAKTPGGVPGENGSRRGSAGGSGAKCTRRAARLPAAGSPGSVRRRHCKNNGFDKILLLAKYRHRKNIGFNKISVEIKVARYQIGGN